MAKIQPDIVVKYKERFVQIIEIKTTMGWERPNTKSDRPFKTIEDRINSISRIFNIREQEILYVLEEPSNVGEYFSSEFLGKKRPPQFPLSQIYPLFLESDPYYWKYPKEFNPDTEYLVNISDEMILKKAEENIVTPFELIIEKILNSIH